VVIFLVSLYRYEVSKHKERVHLLLTFRFCVEFFRFSRLSVVSLPCEWSWAIRLYAVAPYREPTKALMQMLFLRKMVEDGNSPSPDWDRVSSLCGEAKIEKFDMKTKFKKQTNGSIR
jgi:hypothetical protein